MLDHTSTDQALVEAFLRHADELQRYFQRQLHERGVAEDLVQETFLRAFQYLRAGKKIDHMRTFLFSCAANLIIDEWRKRGRVTDVSLDALCEQGFDPGHETVDSSNDVLDARAALKDLEKDEYALLSMRYIQGLAVVDIAHNLQLQPNAVAVRLHRVTRRLAKQIRFRQQWQASFGLTKMSS